MDAIMKTYQFIQPVYHYFEVEAESLDEAYKKTSDLEADDCFDVVVGAWECVEQDEEQS
jgi:hypothetical protein